MELPFKFPVLQTLSVLTVPIKRLIYTIEKPRVFGAFLYLLNLKHLNCFYKMRSRINTVLSMLLFLLAGCSSEKNKKSTDDQNSSYKKFELLSPPEIGDFQGMKFYEGGFSSLSYIPGSNLEFYAVNDRGPNLEMNDHPKAEGNEVKLFPFPDYSPKVVRLRVRNNTLQTAFAMAVKSPVSKLTTSGLPPAYLQNENSETAWSEPNATVVQGDDWGLDAEGITVGNDNDIWICEEYRPSIWRLFDKTAKTWEVFAPAFGSDQNEHSDILKPLPDVLRKIRPNRGFEGITMTPNGMIWAAIQSPLQNPDEKTGNTTRLNRLVKLNPKTGETHMFLYEMNEAVGDIRQKDWKIGDLTAVNDSQLLVLEQAEKGNDKFADVYLVDINKATPLQDDNESGKTPEQFLYAENAQNHGVKTVTKTHLVDLTQNGFTKEHGKAEGLTIVNDTTIAVMNDNDYGVRLSDDLETVTETNVKTYLWLIKTPAALSVKRKND